MGCLMNKLKMSIDSARDLLTRYSKITHLHMVEFIVNDHWNSLLDPGVGSELLSCGGVDGFLDLFTGRHTDETKYPSLVSYIDECRSNYMKVDGETCFSFIQMKSLMNDWGPHSIADEIIVSEFMNVKKCYEVCQMSRIVTALCRNTETGYCLELGGGKGYLANHLTFGYGLNVLTVDCDEAALFGGMRRVPNIKKKWPSLTKGSVQAFSYGQHRHRKHHVNDASDLNQILLDEFNLDNCENVNLCLTGLHSCGDLGPCTLRHYTRTANIRSVCSVPCCYHLMLDGDTSQDCFPMSRYLKGFRLNRNALMLAAQSIDRVLCGSQTSNTGLYYRALLEVILKNHHPNVKTGKLKGLASKCNNFTEYYRIAAKKLSVDKPPTTDGDLTKLSETYDSYRERIDLFYVYRLCLAQVVESLILMDRLMFLYESGCCRSVIVKMLSPVISPRCHALVSMK